MGSFYITPTISSGGTGSGGAETTDSLAEGLINLYFTQTRARQSISVAGAPLTYDASTGVLGYSAPSTGPGSGTVTSVGLSAPTGFSVSGSPVTANGALNLAFSSGYSLPTTAKQGEWDTAFVERLRWDGGSTGLNAATARSSLGLGTVATTDASAYATAAQAAALAARLDAFRDARTFYVSKRITASDSNNGTSPGEPFATIGAAVAAANAYRAANPTEFAAIEIGPGTYVEPALPMRVAPKILVRSLKQRAVRVKPAPGQELNSFFAVDSGCMICDLTFAGHQAQNTSDTDSTVGTRAWAIQFNDQANNGQGVYLTASPYIKDCLSLTAEDDAGEAGSTSTGDCGGGVEVDGGKCHPDSPIRSMVIYGFTQQNLGGPGAIIKNDAYAELVSFFGLFGTWHVMCETGGQATMSGGGCSEFGIYGLVADGYSPTPIFTGTLRVAALAAATTVDVTSLSSNRLGTSNRPAAGQLMLLGGEVYVVQSSTPITASGDVVVDSSPTRAGYRVAFYSPDGVGLAANVAQGATADFRLRSQISAGCHSCNFVGSGTNYSALPWNGGIPNRANEVVERNYGRVFGAIVNDVGDFKIANGVFAIDGTTGAVTINTDQFNLSGLNFIGPFSRNGGISPVGVQLQEVSNDGNLLASTGIPDGNTVPTQFAVKEFVGQRYLTGVTATAGQPITITGSAQVDGTGTWTFIRNIELSLNAPNGLARLDSSGLIPAALLPSFVDDVLEFANLAAFPATGETGKIYVTDNRTYRWSGSAYVEISPSPGSTDSVSEGSVNLYHTTARARQAISGTGSINYDPVTGVISYSAPASGSGSGTVTSVGLSVPTGLSVSGGPITSSGTLSISLASGYSIPTTVSQSNWDTAFTERLRWDGSSTGLNAATARTSLGLGTSATTDASAYQPFDSDLNSIAGLSTTSFGRSLLTQADAAATRTTIGAGTSNVAISSATPQPLGTAAAGSTGQAADAGHVHTLPPVASTSVDGLMAAADKAKLDGLATTGTPQFAALGLGTAAVTGWELTVAGGLCQLRQSVTISGSTYTLDVQAANEFVTAAAINGATTINLSNLNTIPSGYVWRGVLSLQYTSGTVSWFTGNSGYTVKWDGGTAPTLTANDLESVVITVVGGGSTIEVAPLKGRA